MKVAVLLSAGRHPVSGQPTLPRREAQAIALARSLSDEVVGLHAGPSLDGVKSALGHGLSQLVHLRIGAGDDPVPALVAGLREIRPDLVLAGPRSEGGDETGMVPYLVASELDCPVVPEICRLVREGDVFVLDQALPKGVRRRVREESPLVATIHASAPAPQPYAFAAERRGIVDERPGFAVPKPEASVRERAMRSRAKIIGSVKVSASAVDRLRAATETASSGGEVLTDITPEEAARAILAHLRNIGALPLG